MTESSGLTASQRTWRRPIWLTGLWAITTAGLWAGYAIGAYCLWQAGVAFGQPLGTLLLIIVGHLGSALMTAVLLAWLETRRIQAKELLDAAEQEQEAVERFTAEYVVPAVSALMEALTAAIALAHPAKHSEN